MPNRNLPMRPPAIFWQSGGQERQSGLRTAPIKE
jgi:hypothetical protein